MDKALITIAICAISIIVCCIAIHITNKRIKQVQNLPNNVISEHDREDNVKNMTMSLYIMLGGLVLSAINIFLPDGLLKFLIPILVIMVIGFLFSSIASEMDAFNVKKDDVDIYLERQQKQKDDVQKQKDILAQKNKIKREAEAKKEDED